MTSLLVVGLFLFAIRACQSCAAFQSSSFVGRPLQRTRENPRSSIQPTRLRALEEKENMQSSMNADAGNKPENAKEEGLAATNTINERLMEEVKEFENQEKGGARSSFGKKLGLEGFRSEKTDEERQAALEEARNLNGVNPLVALGGAAFALAGAGGLWALTNFIIEYFALHPVVNDSYIVERVTAVTRNVVVGMVSLASGFFGVTGLGILLLAIRVSYGVMTGELDPTPIKKPIQEEVEMPNVWDLMMNKKPGRRR